MAKLLDDFYPTFRYSPSARDGVKFTDRATFEALGPEWVDTPAKLPPVPEPEPEPVKRGRPKKEEIA